MYNDLEKYWRDLARMMRMMPIGTLERAAEMLLDCHRRGGTIFVLGNGGSASTASHFACDLSKGTRVEGVAPFRVMPLTDNAAMLTAWGNDTSFDRVFAEQLVALVRPVDVVVMISASGNSPNVLLAAEVASEAGASTIAMTNHHGGRVSELANLTIRVPVGSIEQVEDAHLAIAHSLCVALRARLQGERDAMMVEAVMLHTAVEEPVAVELGR